MARHPVDPDVDVCAVRQPAEPNGQDRVRSRPRERHEPADEPSWPAGEEPGDQDAPTGVTPEK